jgi:hypothetical protein
MLKSVIAIGVAVGVAIPALAAKDYFVVHGPDEKCKVVETRPTEKTIVAPARTRTAEHSFARRVQASEGQSNRS